MAQSKMADAVLADGRATGYARELAAPSADWFLRTNHAGGGLGGADFTRNTGAHYSSVGDYAGDQRALLVVKDRVGELGHGEAGNTGAPYTSAGGFARDHVALLVDQDRSGGLPLGGVADFLARGHGHGAPLLDKDRAGGLPLGVASSSPNAAQVTIDVDVGAEATAPKAAAGGGGGGGNLASAVVGIVASSSAVTMVAAGDVSPPVAFGLFVLLLAGLSMAVSGVRRV